MKGNLQLMEENRLNDFLNMLREKHISFKIRIVEKLTISDNQDICHCSHQSFHYEYVTPFKSADKYYLLAEIYITTVNNKAMTKHLSLGEYRDNNGTEEFLFGRFPLPWFLKEGKCYRHNGFADCEYIWESPEDWESEPIEVEELPLPPTAI